MFCGKCGIELREGAKFCHKCGAAVALEPEVIAEPIADTPTEPIQEVTPEVAPVAEVQGSQTVPVEQPIKSVRVTKVAQSGGNKQKPTVRLKAVAPAPMAKESEPKQEKQPLPVKEETQNNLPDVKSCSQDEKPTGLPECGTVITRESEPKIELFIEQRQSPVEDIWMESMQKNDPKATPVLELQTTPVAPRVKTIQSTETAYKPKSTTRVKTTKNTPKKEKQAKRARNTKIHPTKDSDVTAKAKRRKKRSKKKKLGVGIVAIFALILVITLFYGKGYISRLMEPDNDSELEVSSNASGLEEPSNASELEEPSDVSKLSEYYEGLVAAENVYGLSTTITLDEFIDSYNTLLQEYYGFKEDGNYEMSLLLYGGIRKNYLDVLSNANGITEYGTEVNSNLANSYINIGVDDQSGYVVYVASAYDKAMYSGLSEALSKMVMTRLSMVWPALLGGHEKTQTFLVDAQENGSKYGSAIWHKGIFMGGTEQGSQVINVTRCTSKEYMDNK